MKKRLIIGGSGSSGTSLLKNILSRHSHIFSGSETSLFCKAELYDGFTQNKWRIAKRFPFGLKSGGFLTYNGTDLLHEEYGHTSLSLKNLIDEATSFPFFCDHFFANGMGIYNKEIWIEKTPCNAFFFDRFLNGFEDAGVIHMVRNPLDTMTSLLNRGFHPVYATGICLLNNLTAWKTRNDERYHSVKYEDLITDAQKTVHELCHFIGIEYEDTMLTPSNPLGIRETKIPSWRFDEMETVQSNNKRNQHINKRKTAMILACMHHLFPSGSMKMKFDLDHISLAELSKQFGYENPDKYISTDVRKEIKLYILKDQWRRTMRLYPFGAFNYPLKWYDA